MELNLTFEALKTTTMSTLEVYGIKPFFEFMEYMDSKKFTYIENQKVELSRDANYFRIDDLGFFALISKEEYETLNNLKK